jgi:hypothetical protein
MLDPRIAAARIHDALSGRHGAMAGRDRIAASSQGGFMTAMMIKLLQKVRNIVFDGKSRCKQASTGSTN